MSTTSPPRPRWVTCHECDRKTNHNVLHLEHDDRWEMPDFQNHILARCGGCGSYRYLIESGDEQDRDRYTGEVEKDCVGYPAAAEYKIADWTESLPNKVRRIYVESMAAVNQKIPLLAGIGLRTLIEAICKDRRIPGDKLYDLIEGLHSKGVLAESQAKILHSLRFLGNAAAHDAVAAKPGELRAGLAIAEALMSTIYVVPALSKEVKTGRKRPRKKKPGA